MTSKKYLFATSTFLILALTVRLYEAFYGHPLVSNLWSDMKGYNEVAIEMGQGIWKKTHFFQSIGYPFVIRLSKLATSNWGGALTFVQAFFSLATILIMTQTTRMSFGNRVGILTLIIGSLHLPWIFFANYAMPEIIFTFFLSISAWLSVMLFRDKKLRPIWGLLWGISFSLAMWLKGTHLFWGPLFFLGIFWIRKKESLKTLMAIALPVVMSLGLHGLLTYSKTGSIQLSASAGGLNFVEGKCPWKNNTDNAGYSWQSPLYHQLKMNTERKWDRPFTDSGYFFSHGLKCIQDSPGTLLTSFKGIYYLFFENTTWPINQKSNASWIEKYEIVFSFFCVIGLGLYILTSLGDRFNSTEFLIWFTPILAIFLCVYIFKSEMRFRIPFDVWFIPVAVVGWSRGIQRLRPEATQVQHQSASSP